MSKAFNDNSDVTANSQQIEILKQHFPQCFDKNGAFIVEKLQQIIGDSGTAFSKESYRLNWLGKSYARLLANENPLTFLSENKAHNQQAEHRDSQNLLIKGDNLEVLKHLKSAYAGQVKMIYIDPPYNTGSDGFVYHDDRKFTPQQLAQLAGVDLEEAKRILTFTQSKANSHSAWLTFMYPRLYVARELLKDDGVIFISIDDNEVAQLRLLCDEVFGEANCLGIVTNVNNPKGRSDDKFFATAHEYLIVYSRNIQRARTKGFEPDESIVKRYNKLDKDLKIFREIDLRKTGDSDRRLDRADMFYYFYFDQHKNFFRVSKQKNKNNNEIEITPLKEDGSDGRWRWGFDKALKNITLLYPKFMPTRKIWSVFEMDYLEGRPPVKPTTSWTFKDVNSERGSEQFIELGFEKEIFPRPKPLGTNQRVLEIGTFPTEDAIILDFFAGSGTTAHAVMALNAQDQASRKYIVVQIAEPCDKKSEAYKAGYSTIFDITQARIEKAAAKIRAEQPDYAGDLGFKLFETVPVPDGYLDEIAMLDTNNADLFDGSTLDQQQLADLLTTWQVYDGIPLTTSLIAVDLADYKGWQQQKILYLVDKNFSTQALTVLLQKLDDTDDKTFDIERIVLFAHNFDSKHQREINEAIKNYQNRKEKAVSVELRY